jgi:hypothetical protein
LVAALTPQVGLDQRGRADLLIAARVELALQQRLELVDDAHALGQPERLPGRHLVQEEQLQLAPQPSVIALLRLLQLPQVVL